MSRELVHTPEGVRDVYGRESYERTAISSRILETMHRFGYENIMTPAFEFFDVFAKEISQASAKDLYKFFDNEGNTLVLRPDFTPSVARCIAKYYMDANDPVRICYNGNIYINTHRLQGKLREHTQLGAELMCDDSIHADAEMIAMMIESVRNTGLKDFIVTLSDADYYRGIVQESGIDDETEEKLRSLIEGRNFYAASDLIVTATGNEKYRETIADMQQLHDTKGLLRAADKVKSDRAKASVCRLLEIYRVLSLYGLGDYVSFDLAMLSEYNYYTGVIFRTYTYGVGDAIAKGGRYDSLLSKFGKDAAAIGFMIDLEYLMSALYSQKIEINCCKEPEIVEYTDDDFEEKLKNVQERRAKGEHLLLIHR